MATANQVMAAPAKVAVGQRAPINESLLQITPKQGRIIFQEVRKNRDGLLPLTEKICSGALSNLDGQVSEADRGRIVSNAMKTAVSAVEQASSNRASGRISAAIGAFVALASGAVALFSKDLTNLTPVFLYSPLFFLAASKSGATHKKVASAVNAKISSEFDNCEDHAKIPAPGVN